MRREIKGMSFSFHCEEKDGPVHILTQGWVSTFSSLNTNFFQACTDNAWQTPVGLKLPPDPRSRRWHTYITRCKEDWIHLFFCPHYRHSKLSVWATGEDTDFKRHIGPIVPLDVCRGGFKAK
ncbi:hypothetical protein CgunFtcFv8_010928 [Champsocephalus gunnari]|uniref:Uncharacterized protein n=1 Tax=Champsocephalus gunnari TaxID=52237 RepID=A0AAN8E3R8_CHAGU|nr:hypothetical protein CgunFtcFv8_010928 [Champsocephalus gunnari]